MVTSNDDYSEMVYVKQQLLEKIEKRNACMAIIGLGHVGLTTAVMFANAGYHVIGSDLRKDVVDAVSLGKSHIREPGLDDLVKKAVKEGKLNPTTNTLQTTREADIVIICVQTPVSGENEPDKTYVENACKTVAEGLSRGKLVIVESTVPPGTTKNTVAKILEQGSRLRCGKDFWLAHCPERITVGEAVRDFTRNVRVVGGYDLKSAEIAAELFKTVTNGEIIITDCTSAEVAKLAENAYRYVNIAFANELALMCERLCVDVKEVIELASTHPRVNIHRPGCGVGGPCLPKDTYLLLYSAKEKKFRSKLIEASREVNEYMPIHVVELLAKALNESGKGVKNTKSLVLGSAYRGEIDDARNSPAEKIIRKLMSSGVDVAVYDPYSKKGFGARKVENILDGAEGADSLVIVTDHKMFTELDLDAIKLSMNKKPVIVDGRRVLDPAKAKRKGFRYFGIGRCV